ncbi:MAG: GNAT family protein [Bacteroidota bacterium]
MIEKAVRLEKFDKLAYAGLVSWVDSKEMLMQFGGPGFNFPLTDEQLEQSLADPNRYAFKVVDNATNAIIGHAQVYSTEDSAILGRILIGEKANRGRGLGEQIVELLLELAFSGFGKTRVQLNVFDWNAGAIKCYEKVGFVVDPSKKLERKINGETWIALNMVIDRQTWEERKNSTKRW